MYALQRRGHCSDFLGSGGLTQALPLNPPLGKVPRIPLQNQSLVRSHTRHLQPRAHLGVLGAGGPESRRVLACPLGQGCWARWCTEAPARAGMGALPPTGVPW